MPQNRPLSGSGPLGFTVPAELLDAVAVAVADELERRGHAPNGATASPWLDVDQAATYLCASRQRVYDLVAGGQLRPAKDGRRSLFRREWLDGYLERPAAT